MKIPRKITPDNLKDSIVQIRFEPNCFPELLLGKFNDMFEDKITYNGESIASLNKNLIGNSIGGHFVDSNGKVKIKVANDNITFNLLSKYPGWNNYSPIIYEIITKFLNSSLVKKITRVGLRYISQYENLSVFDNLKMDISFPLNQRLSSSQFRNEFDSDSFRIIVTLLNLVSSPLNSSLTSIIDIDVIKYFVKNPSNDEIIDTIEIAHNKQKELFFSLLTDDFLKTLKPEY